MPRRNSVVRNCEVCRRPRRLGRYSNICRTCTYILNPEREDPRRWNTTSTTR